MVGSGRNDDSVWEFKRLLARASEPVELKVAFDMGNVIVERGTWRNGSFIEATLEEYPNCNVKAGAFWGLRQICRIVQPRDCFIMKGLPETDDEARLALVRRQACAWLERRNFFSVTGIPETNLIFAKRSEKARWCEEVDIDCLVDDRGEIFQHFHKEDFLLLAFNPNPDEWAKYPQAHDIVRRVRTWPDIVREITSLRARILAEYERTERELRGLHK